MRALPLGLPKLMVSTLASGDVGAYVDVSDIVMMPSVTDIAGLNRHQPRRSCATPRRRSSAWPASPPPAADGKPAHRAHHVRRHHALRDHDRRAACAADYDCLVFHATGTGGRAMEKLADSGLLAGVIDVTTTEVCDLLFGGVLPATDRTASARSPARRLPYVGSVGALDMVNFWAPETVPERYRGRLLLPAQSERDADAHDAGRDAARSATGSAASSTAARGRCAS